MYTQSPVFSTSVISVNPASTMTGYALVWRQKKLIVRRAPFRSAIVVPETVPMEWLVERVRKSPVKLVLVDVKLGVAALQFWAEVAHRAGKPIYVNLKPGRNCHLLAQKKSYTAIGKVVRFFLNVCLPIGMVIYRKLAAGKDYTNLHNSTSSMQFYVNEKGQILKGTGLCLLMQKKGLREQLLQWLNDARGRISLSTAYLLSRKESPLSSEV
ncbi:hypothetical protein ACN4EG_10625 [Alkalinema pantanalense CENA528]|uniref:hypothetical protein n=1 Tax=Alkalinema pantanalense TaxID=1620705 RepID=UPI003D6E26FC